MNLKPHAKSFARVLLHQAGGLSGARFWNRNAFRILMYHDFPSVPGLHESLTKQCAHLARHFELVSMTDIGRYLREGKSLPKNALAVTIDDGNRDFFLNGYPVFKAHHIPFTVFLVSGFLDGKLWLWWDQIHYLVEHTQKTSFELALLPGQPKIGFDISTEAQRAKTVSSLSYAIKLLNRDERLATLNGRLSAELQVELPTAPPPHLGPMAWPEVREIVNEGAEIGAHTVTHPVLSRILDPEELFREIDVSKRRIEEELKRPVEHFCYPYGKREDFNETTLKALERCQFQTSVTALHGLNYKGAHPYRLLRLSVDAMLPELYFRERVAGLHAG